MKALTFQGIKRVSVENIADPAIEHSGDVIVEVQACAICGSDLHVYHGRETGIDSGTAMGHEFCGVVVETGSDIKTFKKGDRVMSPFTVSCGNCFYCRIGLTCRCVQSQLFGWRQDATGLHGGQAQYVRVPLAETTLMHIPEGVDDAEAILLGDVLSTGYHCAAQAQIQPEGTYAVVGCGPVGLMAVVGALSLGASRVLAIDSVPERLAMAARLGAIPVPAGVATKDQILDVTDGRGVDAAMEAVGSGSAVKLAYDLIRPGGIISSVGVCTDRQMAFSPVEAYDKNLTFKSGRCPARFLMPTLIPLVLSHRFPLTEIFTHHMPLEQAAKGYAMFDQKADHCLKVLLHPGQL